MKTEYRYIQFEREPSHGVTSKWVCRNKKHDEDLGGIAWDGGWRQYVFSPCGGCIFSAGCLTDIADFIKQLMDERKAKAKE